MSVKFLSDRMGRGPQDRAERAATRSRRPRPGQTATIQQVITGGDDEHALLDHASTTATIDMGVGDAEAPDATITQSYETAVALAKSELSPVTAFMTGKIKVGGNMGMLLGLQGVLDAAARARWPRSTSSTRSRPGSLARQTATVACARASSRPSSSVTSASANPIDRPTRPTRPRAVDPSRAARRRYCTPSWTVTCRRPGSRTGPDGESRRGVGERREHAAVEQALQVEVIGGSASRATSTVARRRVDRPASPSTCGRRTRPVRSRRSRSRVDRSVHPRTPSGCVVSHGGPRLTVPV